MGNNQAYSQFQRTVITLYDKGKLDLEVLDALGEEWRDTDIDSGGDTGLKTRDGKALEEVCIELVFPGWAPPGFDSLHAYYAMSDEEWEALDDDAQEVAYDKWREVCDGRWGWR